MGYELETEDEIIYKPDSDEEFFNDKVKEGEDDNLESYDDDDNNDDDDDYSEEE